MIENQNRIFSDQYLLYRNPGTDTIEERLLKALKDSGLISEEQFIRPKLVYFQRAARTDKSVSAIKQIVSIKIYESITKRLEDINNLLPRDIRLMGCKRVTASFDAKNFCDARTYSYLMPSFALCPIGDITKEDYRITDDVLKSFNSTLEGYIGSHKFHNFTSGKTFKENSSTRIIRQMSCSGPFFPCNQENIEFVCIRVKGQSFMMHQIRKMIGLAVAIVKGFATEDHLKRSMEEPYMDIPKAPGLGLMLEEVHFDSYNKKFGGDGHHERIEWQDENEAIQNFKEKYIYPVVVETELKEKSMLNWLKTLSLHSYGDTKTYFSSNGSGINPDYAQHSLKVLHRVEEPQDDSNRDSKRVKLDDTSLEVASKDFPP